MREVHAQKEHKIAFLEKEISNIEADLGRVSHPSSKKAISDYLEKKRDLLNFYKNLGERK